MEIDYTIKLPDKYILVHESIKNDVNVEDKKICYVCHRDLVETDGILHCGMPSCSRFGLVTTVWASPLK